MAAFDYIAIDRNGQQQHGVLQGDSARQVRQHLREQSMLPVTVEPVSVKRTNSHALNGGELRLRRGFSPTEQALIMRQLATLLKSGQPLADALHALTRGEQPARVRSVLAAVRAQVLEGQSLAVAMSAFPRHFPELVTASISAGERAGRLNEVMLRLAAHAQQRERVGRSAMLALLYPILLAVLSVAVVAGLVTYVVPRVVRVFATYQQKLPWPTELLISISDILRNYGPVLMLVGAGLTVLVVALYRQPERRQRWQASWLRLPLIGRLIRATEAARFTRTLAILLGSAVPMVDALRVAARVVSTMPVRAAVLQAAAQVREGKSLARSLQNGKWLPVVSLQLIDSGEQSGDLAFLLDQAAEIQEQELDSVVGVITSLAQPILILFVGLMVLFIVLAIMLPILDLNTLVG